MYEVHYPQHIFYFCSEFVSLFTLFTLHIFHSVSIGSFGGLGVPGFGSQFSAFALGVN